jgi:hypothetical protein
VANAYLDHKGDGIARGRQVLFDTLALSRCNFLLKMPSAVSEFAIYFNPKLHTNSFDFALKGQPKPKWARH